MDSKLTCKNCNLDYEGDPLAFRLCNACFALFDNDPPDQFWPPDDETEEP